MLTWTGTQLVAATLRLLLVRRKADSLAAARRTHRQMQAGVFIAGLLWAMLAVLLPAATSTSGMLLVTVALCGMMAGATVAFSGLASVAISFIAATSIGVFWLAFKWGGNQMAPLILIAISYSSMLIVMAIRGQANIVSLIDARLQQESITNDLRQSMARSKQLGEELGASRDLAESLSVQLGQQESILQHALAEAPIALIACHQEGKIAFAAGKALADIGISAARLRGGAIKEAPPPINQLAPLLSDHGRLLHTHNVDNAMEWSADLMALDGRSHLIVIAGVDRTDWVRLRALQEEFLSTVNHRLRNPLAKAVAALELLRHTNDGDKTQTDIATTGLEGLDELLEIINRLNELSQPHDAGAVVTAHSVQALADSLKTAFDAACTLDCDNKRLQLPSAPECSFMFQSGALDRVSREIMSNAVTHCQSDGMIVVTFDLEVSAMDNARFLTVEVQNPLDADVEPPRHWVTEEPRRGTAHDVALHHGFRIGLALVKRICEENGSSFELVRSKGLAKARLRLPVA